MKVSTPPLSLSLYLSLTLSPFSSISDSLPNSL